MNGQKKLEKNYEDGGRVVLSTEWRENGQKKLEGTLKDGKKDGTWTEWDTSGQKLSETTFNNGQESFEPKRLVVGKSSESEYSDLKSAVNASNSGDSIIIHEGTYNIKEALRVRKSNISIEGKGRVEIISSDWFGAVLMIENVSDVRLSNLHLRHSNPPDPLTCSGGVLLCSNSKNITIENCDINGSGVIGIDLRESKNVIVKDNYIHNNSIAPISMDGILYDDDGMVSFMDRDEDGNILKLEMLESIIFFNNRMEYNGGNDSKDRMAFRATFDLEIDEVDCQAVIKTDFKPQKRANPIGVTDLIVDRKLFISVFNTKLDEPIGMLDYNGRLIRLQFRNGCIDSVKDWNDGRDMKEIGYEQTAFLFYGEKKDDKGQFYTQILVDKFQDGLYVKAKAWKWPEFIASGRAPLCLNVEKGFTFYAQPDSSSTQMVIDNYFSFAEIGVTGNHKGEWISIKIAEYDGEFYCMGEGQPTGKFMEGWIIAVTENGVPSIDFCSRGC